MDLKRTIPLSDDLIKRCQTFGQSFIDNYAAGNNAVSHAVSSHGADTDAPLQADSKAAECVAAIWLGLDPSTAVKWETKADDGCDLVVGQVRIDVKWINSWDKYLSWPVKKTSFFEQKNFHLLLLVMGEKEKWVDSWISKKAFLASHKVADSKHKLTAGTWYVEPSELCDLHILVEKMKLRPYMSNVCIDLQQLVQKHGGYMKIPQDAWERYYSDLTEARANMVAGRGFGL